MRVYSKSQGRIIEVPDSGQVTSSVTQPVSQEAPVDNRPALERWENNWLVGPAVKFGGGVLEATRKLALLANPEYRQAVFGQSAPLDNPEERARRERVMAMDKPVFTSEHQQEYVREHPVAATAKNFAGAASYVIPAGKTFKGALALGGVMGGARAFSEEEATPESVIGGTAGGMIAGGLFYGAGKAVGKAKDWLKGRAANVGEKSAQDLIKASPKAYENAAQSGIDLRKLVKKYKIVGSYDDLVGPVGAPNTGVIQNALDDTESLLQENLKTIGKQKVDLSPVINQLSYKKNQLLKIPGNEDAVGVLDDLIKLVKGRRIPFEKGYNVTANEALGMVRAANQAFGKAVVESEKGAVITQGQKVIAQTLRHQLKAQFPEIGEALTREHELILLQNVLQDAQYKGATVGLGLGKFDITRPLTAIEPLTRNPQVSSRIAQMQGAVPETPAGLPSEVKSAFTPVTDPGLLTGKGILKNQPGSTTIFTGGLGPDDAATQIQKLPSKTRRWIEDIISNDDVSTDPILKEFLKKEGKLSESAAKYLVNLRNQIMTSGDIPAEGFLGRVGSKITQVSEAEAGDVVYMIKNKLATNDLSGAKRLFDVLPDENAYKKGMQSFFDKMTPSGLKTINTDFGISGIKGGANAPVTKALPTTIAPSGKLSVQNVDLVPKTPKGLQKGSMDLGYEFNVPPKPLNQTNEQMLESIARGHGHITSTAASAQPVSGAVRADIGPQNLPSLRDMMGGGSQGLAQMQEMSFSNIPTGLIDDFDNAISMGNIQKAVDIRNTINSAGGMSPLSQYLKPMNSLIEQVMAKVSARPPHQVLIEQALNSGNLAKAQEVVTSIPVGDPYKIPMQKLIDTFSSKVPSTPAGLQPGSVDLGYITDFLKSGPQAALPTVTSLATQQAGRIGGEMSKTKPAAAVSMPTTPITASNVKSQVQNVVQSTSDDTERKMKLAYMMWKYPAKATMIKNAYEVVYGKTGAMNATTQGKVEDAQAGLRLLNTLKSKYEEVQGAGLTASGPGIGILKGLGGSAAAALQTSPEAAAYQNSITAFMSRLARAAGEKGVLTDYDIARIQKAIPTFYTAPETARQQWALIESIIGGAIETGKTKAQGDYVPENPEDLYLQ